MEWMGLLWKMLVKGHFPPPSTPISRLYPWFLNLKGVPGAEGNVAIPGWPSDPTPLKIECTHNSHMDTAPTAKEERKRNNWAVVSLVSMRIGRV